MTLPDAQPASPPDFALLSLEPRVLQAVVDAGYREPTPIQQAIIPLMLAGEDVIGQAQTGTGKTAAFALPILSQLDLARRTPQVLVLTPTRELAVQVAESFRAYGAGLPGLNVAAILGGQDYAVQQRQLKRGAQVVVGTPGRLLDLVQRRMLNLEGVGCLVLDEADEMLNMGFLEDVETVLQNTPNRTQTALFSATMPEPVRRIATRYLDAPQSVSLARRPSPSQSIRQRCLFVSERDKFTALARMLEVEDTEGVIVFVRTREKTSQLTDQLRRAGFSAAAIHGELPQHQRQLTIDQLKDGALDVLVATDVAARGLDVQRISHVFNWDAPHDAESYVHRIGRTGRAGRSGEAVLFLTPRQRGRLRSLEQAVKSRMDVARIPSAEQVNIRRVARFQQRLLEAGQRQDLKFYEDLIVGHVESTGQPLLSVAASLAALLQGDQPFFLEQDVREPDLDGDRRDSRRTEHDGPRRKKRPGPPRFSSRPAPGRERFRVEVGRADGVQPGNLVGAIANEAGLEGKHIGPMQIDERHSIVELPQGMPQDIFRHLKRTRVAGKPLRISRLTSRG